jgi:hypothetical protein
MGKMRKLHPLLIIAGLLVGSIVIAVWRPVSARDRGAVADLTRLYLPFVLGVDCFPALAIPPDDVNKDFAVEQRINEIRDQYSLPRFAKSHRITQAALRHSNDMADNNFFDHTGSDGFTAGDRLNQGCYRWQSYGEIIAAGYTTPASVVAAWMDSAGHRGVILDGNLEDFGAGYAYNRKSAYKHYWTVDFGVLMNDHLAASGDYHTCSYHVKERGGEIWVRLYTSQPCELAGEE